MKRATKALAGLAFSLAFCGSWRSNAAEPEPAAVPALQEAPARPDLSFLPRLRFLTTTDFPPFDFLDRQGQLSGFNIDLAREICSTLAIAAKCDIQAVPWDELRKDLEKGQGEAILAGIAISAQSRQAYAFTKPYLRFPGRFVTVKQDQAAEPLARSLKGSTVGAVAGTAHEKFLRERFGGLLVKSYPSPSAMLGDLEAGRLRAAFGDGMRLSFWLNGEDGACCRFAGGPYWAPSYFGSGLAIAAKPGDRALVEALNYALDQIAAKGRFTEFTLRWFPVSFF